MADDENFDMDDDDSEIEDDDDNEENQESDDGDFFPIDEPIIHSTQSNTTVSKSNRDATVNKLSSGVNASNTHTQDNNFEYVGKR